MGKVVGSPLVLRPQPAFWLPHQREERRPGAPHPMKSWGFFLDADLFKTTTTLRTCPGSEAVRRKLPFVPSSQNTVSPANPALEHNGWGVCEKLREGSPIFVSSSSK